jgi:hypothetical protein
MRFLALLNPWDTREGSGLSVAEQHRRATERFPVVVSESKLTYWRIGDPVQSVGERFLLGLAATFSLIDLRLADVLHEALEELARRDESIRIDVINVANPDEVGDAAVLASLFPGISKEQTVTPFVSKWVDGQHICTKWGHEARQFILDAVGSQERAEDYRAILGLPTA